MRYRRLAAVALLALASTAQAAPGCDKGAIRRGDQWWGQDKKLHAGVSFIAGLAARDIFKLDSDAQAFGVAMLPGIAKELLDAADTCNVFSTKDLAADALGAFIGVKVRGWIVTPRSVSYEVSF